MRLTQTIAFRLFLILVAAQTIVLGVLTYATVNFQQSHLMENVEQSAQRVSEVIARSTRHSMLLNRKEEVQQIVASIGGEPGFEGIRIYNKAGEVIFATQPNDIHSKVDVRAEACVSCHDDNQLSNPHPPQEKLWRTFNSSNGTRVLGLITPIRNEQQCSSAPCHAHPPTKTILGVLDVKMSLAQVDEQLAESKYQLLFMSLLAALVVAIASGAFIWIVLRRPIARLNDGMQKVATGHLNHRIDATSNDEFGRLAATFNSMTGDLELARREITDWSNTLEEKVKEKTDAVEHAHRQLVRIEKMASLGNLASSVAHELNNPLEGILTFAKLLMKRLKKSTMPQDEMKPYLDDLQLVADESLRCGNIVKNLLVFSRQSSVSLQSTQLSTIIERCVLLMSHHAKIHGVELRSRIEHDEMVECDANQIQQALIALTVNGIEAMSPANNGKGFVELALVRSLERESVTIQVSDNGIGMSEDVKAHIFEPFFTTKSEGKGVGLGLSIVFGIIQRHHGTIDADSSIGKGTRFTIVLPKKQQVDENNLQMTTEGVHNGKT